MPEHTCPSCLSPVSPRATECPYCRSRLTPASTSPATAASPVPSAAAAAQSPAELGFLRRHVDGRAIYLPLGFRFLAFAVPEERARRIVGAQKDFIVWNAIVIGVVLLARPSLYGSLVLFGLWLVILALILALWLPRGCQRIPVASADLVPVERSPAARARALGKPRLRVSLVMFALMSAIGALILPLRPLPGLAMVVFFGVLAWDSWRCLRTLR